MIVSFGSIEVGKCYLTRDGQIIRVLQFLSDGDLVYATRAGRRGGQFIWAGAVMSVGNLLISIEREVPCDWVPEANEA